MRTPAPPLLPLLRSRLQGDILATTYLMPDREFSVSELARRSSASVKATAHEVSRLVDAGLLNDRRFGNARLVRRGAESPLTDGLTRLLAATYGPIPVLSEALAGLPGVEQAFIYGSWAARYQGEPGPMPNDVDVLVVGHADLDALDDVAHEVQPQLGRAVSIRRVRPGYWRNPAPDDPFITSVRERPLVELSLTSGIAR